jgi:hypothetical protein
VKIKTRRITVEGGSKMDLGHGGAEGMEGMLELQV